MTAITTSVFGRGLPRTRLLPPCQQIIMGRGPRLALDFAITSVLIAAGRSHGNDAHIKLWVSTLRTLPVQESKPLALRTLYVVDLGPAAPRNRMKIKQTQG